ncbi:carbon dioxide concentrating mechanism/carboxysome shell protein [Thermanaerovibrio velox DSM 12556]|uniref:Carbon dioxide concentrating mechanism/carboxysome shell protein n=1 Tax=Thermanaerovibrio velox DSM 12556 TaxID=926567 RepID=H0UQ86_9BACT|nr:carbon dioxide concentrating mechanism/carboxysome shell protein [Thermanaerovibrio velox DSM 12556]
MGCGDALTGKALGMVEVFGMLGAVEAADSALKAASVTLLGALKVKGGIVTVLVAGDVASVRAAVDAAAASVGKVGVRMRGVHVIPRPHWEVWGMLAPGSSPEDGASSSAADEALSDEAPSSGPLEVSRGADEPGKPEVRETGPSLDLSELEALTVMELRRLARSLPVGMSRKRIKFASKEELLRELRSLTERGGGDGSAG